MNIYLIRHADASTGDATFASDDERPLSDEGRRQAERLAAALTKLEAPLDCILTSPLRRARETADLLAQRLAQRLDQRLAQPGLDVADCAELAPGGSPRRLFKLLRKLGAAHVALVGHEPDLGEAAARLIGGKRARIQFAKAGIACVTSDEPPRRGSGALTWMLTPSWLPD
jgi:phosphohistidine phosphatase